MNLTSVPLPLPVSRDQQRASLQEVSGYARGEDGGKHVKVASNVPWDDGAPCEDDEFLSAEEASVFRILMAKARSLLRGQAAFSHASVRNSIVAFDTYSFVVIESDPSVVRWFRQKETSNEFEELGNVVVDGILPKMSVFSPDGAYFAFAHHQGSQASVLWEGSLVGTLQVANDERIAGLCFELESKALLVVLESAKILVAESNAYSSPREIVHNESRLLKEKKEGKSIAIDCAFLLRDSRLILITADVVEVLSLDHRAMKLRSFQFISLFQPEALLGLKDFVRKAVRSPSLLRDKRRIKRARIAKDENRLVLVNGLRQLRIVSLDSAQLNIEAAWDSCSSSRLDFFPSSDASISLALGIGRAVDVVSFPQNSSNSQPTLAQQYPFDGVVHDVGGLNQHALILSSPANNSSRVWLLKEMSDEETLDSMLVQRDYVGALALCAKKGISEDVVHKKAFMSAPVSSDTIREHLSLVEDIDWIFTICCERIPAGSLQLCYELLEFGRNKIREKSISNASYLTRLEDLILRTKAFDICFQGSEYDPAALKLFREGKDALSLSQVLGASAKVDEMKKLLLETEFGQNAISVAHKEDLMRVLSSISEVVPVEKYSDLVSRFQPQFVWCKSRVHDFDRATGNVTQMRALIDLFPSTDESTALIRSIDAFTACFGDDDSLGLEEFLNMDELRLLQRVSSNSNNVAKLEMQIRALIAGQTAPIQLKPWLGALRELVLSPSCRLTREVIESLLLDSPSDFLFRDRLDGRIFVLETMRDVLLRLPLTSDCFSSSITLAERVLNKLDLTEDDGTEKVAAKKFVSLRRDLSRLREALDVVKRCFVGIKCPGLSSMVQVSERDSSLFTSLISSGSFEAKADVVSALFLGLDYCGLAASEVTGKLVRRIVLDLGRFNLVREIMTDDTLRGRLKDPESCLRDTAKEFIARDDLDSASRALLAVDPETSSDKVSGLVGFIRFVKELRDSGIGIVPLECLIVFETSPAALFAKILLENPALCQEFQRPFSGNESDSSRKSFFGLVRRSTALSEKNAQSNSNLTPGEAVFTRLERLASLLSLTVKERNEVICSTVVKRVLLASSEERNLQIASHLLSTMPEDTLALFDALWAISLLTQDANESSLYRAKALMSAMFHHDNTVYRRKAIDALEQLPRYLNVVEPKSFPQVRTYELLKNGLEGVGSDEELRLFLGASSVISAYDFVPTRTGKLEALEKMCGLSAYEAEQILLRLQGQETPGQVLPGRIDELKFETDPEYRFQVYKDGVEVPTHLSSLSCAFEGFSPLPGPFVRVWLSHHNADMALTSVESGEEFHACVGFAVHDLAGAFYDNTVAKLETLDAVVKSANSVALRLGFVQGDTKLIDESVTEGKLKTLRTFCSLFLQPESGITLKDIGVGIPVYDIREHTLSFAWIGNTHIALERLGELFAIAPTQDVIRFCKISSEVVDFAQVELRRPSRVLLSILTYILLGRTTGESVQLGTRKQSFRSLFDDEEDGGSMPRIQELELIVEPTNESTSSYAQMQAKKAFESKVRPFLSKLVPQDALTLAENTALAATRLNVETRKQIINDCMTIVQRSGSSKRGKTKRGEVDGDRTTDADVEEISEKLSRLSRLIEVFARLEHDVDLKPANKVLSAFGVGSAEFAEELERLCLLHLARLSTWSDVMCLTPTSYIQVLIKYFSQDPNQIANPGFEIPPDAIQTLLAHLDEDGESRSKALLVESLSRFGLISSECVSKLKSRSLLSSRPDWSHLDDWRSLVGRLSSLQDARGALQVLDGLGDTFDENDSEVKTKILGEALAIDPALAKESLLQGLPREIMLKVFTSWVSSGDSSTQGLVTALQSETMAEILETEIETSLSRPEAAEIPLLLIYRALGLEGVTRMLELHHKDRTLESSGFIDAVLNLNSKSFNDSCARLIADLIISGHFGIAMDSLIKHRRIPTHARVYLKQNALEIIHLFLESHISNSALIFTSDRGRARFQHRLLLAQEQASIQFASFADSFTGDLALAEKCSEDVDANALQKVLQIPFKSPTKRNKPLAIATSDTPLKPAPGEWAWPDDDFQSKVENPTLKEEPESEPQVKTRVSKPRTTKPSAKQSTASATFVTDDMLSVLTGSVPTPSVRPAAPSSKSKMKEMSKTSRNDAPPVVEAATQAEKITLKVHAKKGGKQKTTADANPLAALDFLLDNQQSNTPSQRLESGATSNVASEDFTWFEEESDLKIDEIPEVVKETEQTIMDTSDELGKISLMGANSMGETGSSGEELAQDSLNIEGHLISHGNFDRDTSAPSKQIVEQSVQSNGSPGCDDAFTSKGDTIVAEASGWVDDLDLGLDAGQINSQPINDDANDAVAGAEEPETFHGKVSVEKEESWTGPQSENTYNQDSVTLGGLSIGTETVENNTEAASKISGEDTLVIGVAESPQPNLDEFATQGKVLQGQDLDLKGAEHQSEGVVVGRSLHQLSAEDEISRVRETDVISNVSDNLGISVPREMAKEDSAEVSMGESVSPEILLVGEDPAMVGQARNVSNHQEDALPDSTDGLEMAAIDESLRLHFENLEKLPLEQTTEEIQDNLGDRLSPLEDIQDAESSEDVHETQFKMSAELLVPEQVEHWHSSLSASVITAETKIAEAVKEGESSGVLHVEGSSNATDSAERANTSSTGPTEQKSLVTKNQSRVQIVPATGIQDPLALLLGGASAPTSFIRQSPAKKQPQKPSKPQVQGTKADQAVNAADDVANERTSNTVSVSKTMSVGSDDSKKISKATPAKRMIRRNVPATTSESSALDLLLSGPTTSSSQTARSTPKAPRSTEREPTREEFLKLVLEDDE